MPTPRPPKKSDSLEIRLPYATKQAFMARCQAEQQSASEALRGFIERHLEVSRPPARKPWRNRRAARLALGGVLALALGAVALPSLARPSLRAAFDRLDTDHDGAISLAELSRAAKVDIDVDLGSSPLTSRGEHLALATTGAQAQANANLRDAVVRVQFARLDRDGDGRISFEEFRRHYARP